LFWGLWGYNISLFKQGDEILLKIMGVRSLFEEEEKFEKSQLSDLFDNKRRCLRYHYTNVDALIKILHSEHLRLTHYAKLNDTSEGAFILEGLKNELPNYGEIHTLLTSNYYLSSFCFYGNLLSQWARYGNVNIGFDYESMRTDFHIIEDTKGIDHDTSGTEFQECQYISYKSDDYKNIIKEILEKYRYRNIDFQKIIDQQYICLSIGSSCFYIKDLVFREECEFRIISYLWDRIPFIEKDKDIKFIKYHFKPENIRRIVIGPGKSQDEDIKKIESYLNKAEKYRHVEIYKSTMPYLKRNND